MKIYVAEMPERAYDCPFVKDYINGTFHKPMCGLSVNKDGCFDSEYNECSLNGYKVSQGLEKPKCDNLILLSIPEKEEKEPDGFPQQLV